LLAVLQSIVIDNGIRFTDDAQVVLEGRATASFVHLSACGTLVASGSSTAATDY
jgi:hypothetical protein